MDSRTQANVLFLIAAVCCCAALGTWQHHQQESCASLRDSVYYLGISHGVYVMADALYSLQTNKYNLPLWANTLYAIFLLPVGAHVVIYCVYTGGVAPDCSKAMTMAALTVAALSLTSSFTLLLLVHKQTASANHTSDLSEKTLRVNA